MAITLNEAETLTDARVNLTPSPQVSFKLSPLFIERKTGACAEGALRGDPICVWKQKISRLQAAAIASCSAGQLAVNIRKGKNANRGGVCHSIIGCYTSSYRLHFREDHPQDATAWDLEMRSAHIVPQSAHTVPQSAHIVPQSAHTVPQIAHIVPHSAHIVPQIDHIVPHSAHIVPHSAQIVPYSAHTVPQSVHIVPQSAHTVPIFYHTVPTLYYLLIVAEAGAFK
ncbi:hypothetical protein AVEN_100707-1 [Araneus ventricosus]|uniref:Uncharacterized protein n=1 Tax=Araneus ventricosus TaxID=182803 RepID=A0A4Y2CSS1_ARAVE|nr:hypothetical protein AVEN_100707-1 [Araneus ventricosus]